MSVSPETRQRIDRRQQWPGAIGLSVVAVYALAVPLVLGLRLKTAERAAVS
ncbi:hypothetical protein K6M90_19430 [Rhizobium sp. 9T]|uniref:ABC transporter permease n=1 Tax=Rhizobium croatiense TaxID=2867516 RepID=A0ABS7M8T2_9HYPH|nr:hypothetical protein [Rhizobium croatiense]MBY4609815.1 hypothetical protein [Rhizobium croatiense]MBY4633428.1 hypothetical protein [Rhizobium croatiense]